MPEDELRRQTGERFLPIRSRLVYWSFGIGLALLSSLAVIAHLYAER